MDDQHATTPARTTLGRWLQRQRWVGVALVLLFTGLAAHNADISRHQPTSAATSETPVPP